MKRLSNPRPLNIDEIEVRVGQQSKNKGQWESLLLYKTARTDKKLLDEFFGEENWQNSFSVIKDVLYCTISVWDEDKQQWISKTDAGKESNMESEKGEASDAFKRAGFKWGIGIELYDAPQIRVWGDKFNLEDFHSYEVTGLAHDEKGKISFLEVTYKSRNTTSVCFTYGSKKTTKKVADTTPKEEPKEISIKVEKPTEKATQKITSKDLWKECLRKMGYNFSLKSDDAYNINIRNSAKTYLVEEFDIKDLNSASDEVILNAWDYLMDVKFEEQKVGPENFVGDEL